MNVLLTSAGRRTYMAEYFRKALDGKGLVFVSNSVPSPALMEGDGSFLTPVIYSDEYIPFLLEKCAENRIGLIVPLFDIDLPVLAAHREEFDRIGTKIAVSDTKMLSACNDKLNMFLRLRQHGIASPETYVSNEQGVSDVGLQHCCSPEHPVIVKPRFGMGSIGVLKAYSEEELRAAVSMCRRAVTGSYLSFESAADPDRTVLIQELKQGSEYGIDVICDLDGSYVNTIVRKKIAMRSGETDEAVILGPEDRGFDLLRETGRRLAEVFGPRGLMDVDIIMDTDEGIPYVIDMNARFGGGYPFSHCAGADVPRAYIMWAEGITDPERALTYCTAGYGVHGFKDIAIRRYL